MLVAGDIQASGDIILADRDIKVEHAIGADDDIRLAYHRDVSALDGPPSGGVHGATDTAFRGGKRLLIDVN
jgi:hypothetical protein